MPSAAAPRIPFIVFFITLKPFAVVLVLVMFFDGARAFRPGPFPEFRVALFDAMLRARSQIASKAIIPVRSSGMTESETVWKPRAGSAQRAVCPAQEFIVAEERLPANRRCGKNCSSTVGSFLRNCRS
jgi:hypothetical protein